MKITVLPESHTVIAYFSVIIEAPFTHFSAFPNQITHIFLNYLLELYTFFQANTIRFNTFFLILMHAVRLFPGSVLN